MMVFKCSNNNKKLSSIWTASLLFLLRLPFSTLMYCLSKNAHRLFDKITQPNSLIRNSLLSLYRTSTFNSHINCEDLNEFHYRNDTVVSWTSKISNLVRQNQPQRAIATFKAMLLSDERPNFVTLVSVVRALGTFRSQELIWVAHGFVIKMGFDQEAPVVTALIGFYSNFDMEIAWRLFHHVTDKDDLVLWSAMVSACVKNGKYKEAIDCFRTMQCCYNGGGMNHVSVISVLPACAHLGEVWLGNEIHGFLVKQVELYCLTNVQNALVDMYAKCGKLDASLRIFDGRWKKDMISWRSMTHACIENGVPKVGLRTFLKMHYCCFHPDEIIVRNVIVASFLAGEYKFGLGFHGYLVKNGFLVFVSIGTALMQMYGKLGKFNSARVVFDQLDYKDTVAWSGLISVYAQGGQSINALIAFKHMRSTDENPNEITFVSLLQACSSMDAQIGESVHGYITKAGYSSNAYLISTLIDLYCKLGRIKDGEAVFNEISRKDLICWSSMTKGYGANGHALKALETFLNMLECGVKPNDIVFLSVLSACSQCGLEYEGWNWFYSMEEEYGVSPKLAHYACMVDLLCRQGNLEEAFDFVRKMPVEPDKRIWGSLLAGCRSRSGSIEMVKFVVEKLNALDPETTSYDGVLLGLYAEEGRWEDVQGLADLMDAKWLNKGTLCSLIEANYSSVYYPPFIKSLSTLMKKGILEVLLVHAEGIKHTNLVGTPAYYVIMQCGTQVHKSKISSGKDEKAWWNEKFKFEFSLTDWKHLTHLKFRIMDKEFFKTEGGFVGETIIFLGGIKAEGIDKGFLEVKPAAYNVVLEDDTYRGLIKIGFKFTTDNEVVMERRTFHAEANEPRQSVCRPILNLCKFPWWRVWFHRNQRNSKDESKQN